MVGALKRILVALTSASFILQPALLQAQTDIGVAQKVVRDVSGTLQANVRTVIVDESVFGNERIDTGPDSAARLVFRDRTILAVGAGSSVTLDEFVFDPDASKSKVAISMTKGVLRFVTGNLPKQNYQIRTPTALIGIRGTILTVTVAADGTTTVSVAEGVATVTSGGATTTVQSGFTATAAPGAPPGPPVPSPPAPPAVQAMNTALGPDPGSVADAGEESGLGGLSTGAIAAGIAAAAALAVLVATISDDDNNTAATSTSTATSSAVATQ